MNAPATNAKWQSVCSVDDLVENSGICALVEERQIAIFYLPKESPKLYAVGNWDPIGKANVISRGIVGDIDERLVVASPLYKQHFDLLTGECLEEDVRLPSYAVAFDGDKVVVAIQA